MKRLLIITIYTISSFLEDVAFFILGEEKEDIDIMIETPWSRHWY